MAKILWIEDDKEVIDATKIILEREGWEIHVAYSADEGTDLAGKIEPDLIICDIIIRQFQVDFGPTAQGRSGSQV